MMNADKEINRYDDISCVNIRWCICDSNTSNKLNSSKGVPTLYLPMLCS